MAAQWFIPGGVMPISSVMIDEDGTDEYFIPALGMFNENQPAAEVVDVGLAGQRGHLRGHLRGHMRGSF